MQECTRAALLPRIAAAVIALPVLYWWSLADAAGPWRWQLWAALIAASAAVLGYLARESFSLFVHAIYFALYLAAWPLMDWQRQAVGIDYPGLTWLVPVALYAALATASPRLRARITWNAAGRIDAATAGLMAVMALLTGLALVGWVVILRPDLSWFFAGLPNVTPPFLVLGGLGFALTNAAVEEFVFRGVVMDGLAAYTSRRWLIVALQALLFGMLHWHGFPSGPAGVVMVTVWGIFLGVIRQRSGGMLAPWVSHIGADLVIFGLIAGLR